MRKLTPVGLTSLLATAPLALACNDVDLDEDEDPTFADAPEPEDDRPEDDNPVAPALPVGIPVVPSPVPAGSTPPGLTPGPGATPPADPGSSPAVETLPSSFDNAGDLLPEDTTEIEPIDGGVVITEGALEQEEENSGDAGTESARDVDALASERDDAADTP